VPRVLLSAPRVLLSPLLVLALAVGCTGAEEPAAQATSDAPLVADEPSPEADPAPRTCRVDELEDEPVVDLRDPDPVATSHALARRTHVCADTVVVAADDGWAAALAVAVAVAEDAPLLLTAHDELAATSGVVADLDAEQVLTVGLAAADPAGLDGATPIHATDDVVLGADAGVDQAAEEDDDPGTDHGVSDADGDGASDEDGDGDADRDAGGEAGDAEVAPDPEPDEQAVPSPVTLALGVLDHLDADRAYAVAVGDEESRAAAVTRDGGGTPLLPVPDDDTELATFAAELPGTLRVEVVAADAAAAATLADRLVGVGVDAEPAAGPRWGDRPTDTLWLVDPAQGPTAAAVAATAAGRGETVLPIDADDLRAGRERTERFVDLDPTRAVLVGDVTEDAGWQLPTLLEGARLPTGGLTLFEDERMVALYGTPSSTVLGALGEQDLDATVARVRKVAEPYGADGRRVIPAFEIIVTIASAEAGDQGDYSRRLDPDSFRPWIDRAAEEGFYVILDLQPGRTDFLRQAKEYEELLREPHVGLALDPEWRLEDDQVHLRQIGSVDAAEVQEVADWLAELVREHRLPQKLLVLHQFRHSMLPDRDEVVAPPELAVVVHMDGQGAIGTKYETYDAITRGAEDRWWWGWKNFYDEDDPTPTPEQVLELDPLPVFVSYQ
jgi:hypothetical protein